MVGPPDERPWNEVKFRQNDDYAQAQQLMDQQLETDWVEALNGFARQLNPLHQEIQYEEGKRVKYWMDGNSAKMYDKAYAEGAVPRAAETTLNNVSMFKTYRPKEGGPAEDLQWREMRKGIADLHRRAEVSQHINNRIINALASVDDSRTLEELTAAIQQPLKWKGVRVRALQPLGADKPLLEAINRGDFLVNRFRNRDLQQILFDGPAECPQQQRRRSAAISYHDARCDPHR